MTGFKPQWPGGNRHFQSILPSILPRRRLRQRAAAMLAASRELILDCGDGVRLQAFHARPAKPIGRAAILLHGWEGSAESYYVVALAARLHGAGIDVVRLNLRDHGDTHHLNEGVFHSCRLPEVCGAVAALGAQLPAEPWLIGFSLGGNFMLRVAASGDPRLPKLAGVIAVSPVLHPDSAMRAMEEGWPVYQRYFVKKWSRSLQRKRGRWNGLAIDTGILALANLREMTREMVVRFTEFPDIDAYLNGYAITGARLENIDGTCDHPCVLGRSNHPRRRPGAAGAQSAPEGWVTVPHGGHMGFMVSPWKESWVNDFVATEMGLQDA